MAQNGTVGELRQDQQTLNHVTRLADRSRLHLFLYRPVYSVDQYRTVKE